MEVTRVAVPAGSCRMRVSVSRRLLSYSRLLGVGGGRVRAEMGDGGC